MAFGGPHLFEISFLSMSPGAAQHSRGEEFLTIVA
jgi:hypothetical protein